MRLQHSQEVNEMEEILQKEISEVRENQLAKVRKRFRDARCRDTHTQLYM